MPNVMSIDLRANTEKARDDVKATLTQAAQAARDFRNEMYTLRDAQLRAREAVNATRQSFHDVQAEIIKAKDALRNYHAELKKSSDEQARLAAERTKLTAQVAKAQKEYDAARKNVAFSGFAGAESVESRKALQNLQALQAKLGDVSKAHQSASGSVGYYRRQVNQSNQDISRLSGTLTQHGATLRKANDDSARLATTKSALSNKIAENRDQIKDASAALSVHNRALRDDDAAHKQLAGEGMTTAVAVGTVLANMFMQMVSTIRTVASETIQYAARTQELGVALEQVARINGISTGQITEQEVAMRRLNITTQDARSVLAQFIVTELDLSKAGQLARVAQDLGVIAGRDTSDELQHLVRGIETLQIRALRTAGVFVSLQGSLREAAIASGRTTQSFSEQEKQQLLMNKVLDFGARATGTYEAAMTTASKQQRSMIRLWAEAQNALGELFQGPFLLGIKIVSQLLTVMAKFPGATLVVVAGLTAIAGSIALAVAASQGWTAVLLEKIVVLRQATVAALQFSVATQTVAAAEGEAAAAGAVASAGLTASIGLWLGIAAAVGAAIYVIYKLSTAQREANYQKDEEYKIAVRAINVNQQDAANLRERAKLIDVHVASQEEANQQTKEYHMALLRLAPDQQLAISRESNQAKAYDMTAAALEKLNDKLLENIRIGARADAYSFGRGTTSKGDLEKQYERGRAFSDKAMKEGLHGMDSLRRSARELFGVGGARPGETLEEYLNTYKSQNLNEQSKIIAEQEAAARRAADFIDEIGKKMYGQQFDSAQYLEKIVGESELKKGTQAYNEFKVAIDNALAARKAAAEYNPTEQAFLMEYEQELDKVRIANLELQNVEEGRVQLINQLAGRMEYSMNKLGNFDEAVALNRSAANQLNDILANSSASQEEYNARIEALPELLRNLLYAAKTSGARGIEQIGEAASKQQHLIADLTMNLRSLRRELTELYAGGGQLGSLVTQQKALEQLKSEAESIVQMRAELGVGVGDPMSGVREERLAEARMLKTEIDARDELRNVVFEQEKAKLDASVAMIASTLRVVDAETLAARNIGQAIRQRRIDEQELTAEIITLSNERQANAANEAGVTLRAYKNMLRDRLKADVEAQDRLAGQRARNASLSLGGLYNLPAPQDIKITLPDMELTPQVQRLTDIKTDTGAMVNQLSTIINTLKGSPLATVSVAGQRGTLGSFTSGNQNYDQLILQNAQSKGIDPLFVLAMMHHESGSKPGATSYKGASGLMQMMPGTFARMGGRGKNIYDPAANIDAGTNYIKYLMEMFGADRPDLVLAAYNAGEGAVKKFGGIPPYAETKKYVPAILDNYKRMRAMNGDKSGFLAINSAIAAPKPTLDQLIKSMLDRSKNAPIEAGDSTYIAALNQKMADENRLSGRPGFDETGWYGRALTQEERGQDFLMQKYGLPAGRREEVITTGTNIAQVMSEAEDIVRLQKVILDTQAEAEATSARMMGGGTQQDAVAALEQVSELIARRTDEANNDYDRLNALNSEYYRNFLNSEAHMTQVAVKGAADRRQAEVDALEEVMKLRDDSVHAWEGAAARISLAYERAMNELAHADEQAMQDIVANTARIADNQHLHLVRMQSDIVSWAASQKSVTETMSDLFTGTIDAGFAGLDKVLSKHINQNTVLGGVLKDFILNTGKSAVAGIIGQIFGAVPGVGTGDGKSDLKTVQSMQIQSAGQIIINGAGQNAGNNFATAIGNAVGLPAPVAQAIGRGIIPTSGGGVFNIGSNGLVTNGSGNPLGAIANIGMGNGSITNPTSARNSALAQIFSGGFGGFNMPKLGPGGTAPFNPDAASGLLGLLTGAGATAGTGVTPTQAPRTGLGGIFSNLLSGSKSFFGQVLGGGKYGGIFGTAKTGGTFGFGNSGFAQMLPLMGAQFGGMLGGSSGLGQILGTAGGALAGIGLMGAPAILTGSGALAGSLGFLAPLFSNPITAIVGGALLVGAILLGRNSRRRKEEQQRTQILGDAKTQLQQILTSVQHDRMDGASAIAQAQQIRQQYLDQVGQLKDKKTRNIALATVRELDYFINQITAAAAAQDRRKELDNALVPEFGYGGAVSTAHSYGQGRGGIVSGVDMGHDTVLARLRPREVVLNMQQQRRAAAMYGGDVFRNIGVPGFNTGGSYNATPINVTNKNIVNGDDRPIILVADEKYADDLASRTGGKVIKMSAVSLKNKDGPLYEQVSRLSGRR